MNERPFDNFRLAIADPRYFFGREKILSAVTRSPFQVRILLGGRRMGKTSTLNAVTWTLLNTSNAFPVFFNFQQDQPKSLDNFRYLLINKLQEAIASYKGQNRGFRQKYLRFLRQISGGEISGIKAKLNVTNPHRERSLVNEDFREDLLKLIEQLQKRKMNGICFIIDGAEFIVKQDWANDCWSYLRALKDTDTAIKPFVGFLLSGYRDLKDYQQRVGSPLLNIAEVNWLAPLTETETRTLINCRSQEERITLTAGEINCIVEWAGGHPYLTQQMLNAMFDDRRGHGTRSTEKLTSNLVRKHDPDFAGWWDESQRSYCFSSIEQKVYQALVSQREGTPQTLARQAQLSEGEVADALEVMVGTGVIRQLDEERYAMGAKLFEEWVARERS